MYILSADSRRCIVPGFLNLCLVEIVLSADPARAVYVQSPMHGVHTWPKVLVWTPETLHASQSERDTSVPCCLYLSKNSNALDYIRAWTRAAEHSNTVPHARRLAHTALLPPPHTWRCRRAQRRGVGGGGVGGGGVGGGGGRGAV